MLPEKINSYNIILASASPRRSDLLKKLGVEFTLANLSGVTESYPPELKEGEIAEYLARLKSDHYSDPLAVQDLLITADTVVWHKDHLLGKPADPDQAREMLNELAGNIHQVFTGVCLRDRNRKHSFVSETSVKFSELDSDEINYYVENYKPFDKAGAYGIQEWIGFIAVEEINGSYFNVMGLPVQQLYRELINFINT